MAARRGLTDYTIGEMLNEVTIELDYETKIFDNEVLPLLSHAIPPVSPICVVTPGVTSEPLVMSVCSHQVPHQSDVTPGSDDVSGSGVTGLTTNR